MSFNKLIKFWEKSSSPDVSDEDYLEAAQELLKSVSCGVVEVEGVEELKPYGPVFIPVVKSEVPLGERVQQAFKNGFGIEITPGKFVVVNVPHQRLGSNAYVAFEKSLG